MWPGFVCKGGMRKRYRKSLSQGGGGCNTTGSRVRTTDDRQRKTLPKRLFPDIWWETLISYFVLPLPCDTRAFASSIRDGDLRLQAVKASWRKLIFFHQTPSVTMSPGVPHCPCEALIALFSFWFSESSLFQKARNKKLRKFPVQVLAILEEGVFPGSPVLVVVEMGTRLALGALNLQWFSIWNTVSLLSWGNRDLGIMARRLSSVPTRGQEIKETKCIGTYFCSYLCIYYSIKSTCSCLLQLSKKVSFTPNVFGRLEMGCPEPAEVLEFPNPKS